MILMSSKNITSLHRKISNDTTLVKVDSFIKQFTTIVNLMLSKFECDFVST